MGTVLVALLILIAAVAAWWALRLRATTGLPWAPIRIDDTAPRHNPTKPLISKRYGLSGMPDYLLEIGKRFVPVEVKPSRRAEQPYEADLMQLAAYCLLVEESTGTPPPYGLLRYAEHTFRLAYTPAVRAEVLTIIEDMRDALAAADCARSHNEARRCSGCGMRAVCTESLADAHGS